MEYRQGSSYRKSKSLPHEVMSIILLGTAFFILIALLTYHPTDPSWLTRSSDPLRDVARNACGRVGAQVAALLLECFGLGAFLAPFAFGFLASSVHRREGGARIVGTLGGMTIAVMSFAVFLTLQWKYWPYAGSLLLTGGAFGAWCADALLMQFNFTGASIVSFLLFLVALAVSTPLSVAQLGANMLLIASRITWRLVRLGGTYLLYLGGLLAMRAAHSAGDALQKLFETAQKRKSLPSKEIPVDAEVVASKSVERLREQSIDTVITTQSYREDENEIETEEVEGEDLVAVTSAQLALKVAKKNMGPEILPPERDLAVSYAAEANEKASAAASIAAKAAAKLAKFARAGKTNWKLPTVEFLKKPPRIESSIDREKLIQNSQLLTQKFKDFGIDGEVTAVRPGPVITLYEFKPGPGVKVSRIAALADDLSMALSAQSVRILAPLPGKAVVGIEIPSEQRETVYMREFLQHPDFYGTKHAIPVIMGKDIGGQTVLSDLARMPHLLCAGQTGSGKSVFMNGLICSLFYRFTPDELRMILVDPKFIEFRAYQDLPHLLLPVVDDPKQASTALKWAVREMERRYRILAIMGAKNLAGFNSKVEEMGSDVVRDLLLAEENQIENPAQVSGGDWIEAFEPDEQGAPRIGKLPYIVVIIDELADLMMIAKKEVEISIARIAQKARAAGIHLVIATQRPSTDVITGLIKANLPSRVSFQLASYIDSKTILDRAGAERLLGQGDMLFIPPGVSTLNRLHGAYVTDDEIEKITSFLKSQGKPVYRDEILVDEESEENDLSEGEEQDILFHEAVEMVRKSGHASASFLQRHLKVGYNRAARMIETMEQRGIVGPPDGARPREVLMR